MAEEIRRAGASVTTVGVDVDYNERIMAGIAQQSNGRHYFVDNPSELSRIFDQELDGLERTVARTAELRLDAPEGVELVEVMDRSFRRDGERLVVDLGSLAENEEKTVLVRVRVDAARSGQGNSSGRGSPTKKPSAAATANARGARGALRERPRERRPRSSGRRARAAQLDARDADGGESLVRSGGRRSARRRLTESLDGLKKPP